jgi:hypothetical protein
VVRSAVIELDFPVEPAAKLIRSAGLIQPRNGDSAKKLVERVNQIEGLQDVRLRRGGLCGRPVDRSTRQCGRAQGPPLRNALPLQF